MADTSAGKIMVAWPIQPEPLSPEPPGPSVLITDDNGGWRQAVEEILARAGFRTLQAACGEEAIEVVRHERLDILLIDFHMPRLDGIQTIRLIRRENVRLPVVLMTAEPTEVPTDEVRALRVESVLTKPADRRVIITTVTRIVLHHG
jgi:CheY-like chemotaxis protein